MPSWWCWGGGLKWCLSPINFHIQTAFNIFCLSTAQFHSVVHFLTLSKWRRNRGWNYNELLSTRSDKSHQIALHRQTTEPRNTNPSPCVSPNGKPSQSMSRQNGFMMNISAIYMKTGANYAALDFATESVQGRGIGEKAKQVKCIIHKRTEATLCHINTDKVFCLKRIL